MDAHNRAVLHRLQLALGAGSADTVARVADLQHLVAEAARLLDRSAGSVVQALHDADADLELLLFATPLHQQRQRLEDLLRRLQTEVAAALDR